MNVCIVVLDSLRKDIWDKYNSRLKSMADVDLNRCYAPSSWSAPSHASMFTGQLPSEVGIHTYQKSYSHVDTDETLFDVDARRIGISSNMYVNVHYNFDKFFDEFYNLHAAHPNPKGIHVVQWLNDNKGISRYPRYLFAALQHDHTVASLRNGVALKLDDVSNKLPIERPLDEGARAINRRMRAEVDDEPWLMFVNHMETHTPHRRTWYYNSSFTEAPRSWSSYDFDHWAATMRRLNGEQLAVEQRQHAQWFRELYSASADYIDRCLSDTIETIQQRTEQETVFVVTADHGENLFLADDEDVWGHSASMSEALLRVPFAVINAPSWLQEDIPEAFSLLNLPELVQNIRQGVREWPTSDPVLAELIGGGVGLPDKCHEFLDRAIRVVYSDNRKWQWDTCGNRSHKEWDASVEEEFPDDIEDMKRRESARNDETDLDQQARERLEDLGYV